MAPLTAIVMGGGDDMPEARLSWQTIVGAGVVVGLMTAAQWTIFQNEFSSVKETASFDRTHGAELKTSLDKYLTKDEHKAYLDGVTRDIIGLKDRMDGIQRTQTERASRFARDPVEQKTMDAVTSAIDKRIDLIQAQIADINRQIAAALIIIDNNNTVLKRSAPLLPP